MYGAIAAIGGAIFLILAVRLNRSFEGDRRTAQRLFLFSIAYLFVLFATLLIDHRGEPSSFVRAPQDGIVNFNEV